MGFFSKKDDEVAAPAPVAAAPVVEQDSPTVAFAKWMFDNYSQMQLQSIFHSYQPLLDAFLADQGFTH
jgi:hypothetical protein